MQFHCLSTRGSIRDENRALPQFPYFHRSALSLLPITSSAAMSSFAAEAPSEAMQHWDGGLMSHKLKLFARVPSKILSYACRTKPRIALSGQLQGAHLSKRMTVLVWKLSAVTESGNRLMRY